VQAKKVNPLTLPTAEQVADRVEEDETDEFVEPIIHDRTASRETEWKQWFASRPKWFWIVAILGLCLIGGILQMTVLPSRTSRFAEEEAEKKRLLQQQAAGTTQTSVTTRQVGK
jgi:hypothetical protein